jgi:hypothetical protein
MVMRTLDLGPWAWVGPIRVLKYSTRNEDLGDIIY